jgi:hypothetical protein
MIELMESVRYEMQEPCHESDPRCLQTDVVAKSCYFSNGLGL